MNLDCERHKKSKNYNAMTPMPMIIPTNVRTIPMLKDFDKFFILTLRLISYQFLNFYYLYFQIELSKKVGFTVNLQTITKELKEHFHTALFYTKLPQAVA